MPDMDYAQEWLKIAERDYAVALHLSEAFRPLPTENICYGCQQSMEKSLKAVLAYNEADIPKAHDIILLLELCRQYTNEVSLDIKIAGTITRFATMSRYPDNVVDFTKEDAELGLKYAKQVLDMVKEVLKPPQEQET